MIGIYYGNGWNSRSLPFMSTRMLTNNGTTYPLHDVFPGGVLDETALTKFGLPRLTGTFAFAMFMANAAMGALIVHCILFWGKDIRRAYKDMMIGTMIIWPSITKRLLGGGISSCLLAASFSASL